MVHTILFPKTLEVKAIVFMSFQHVLPPSLWFLANFENIFWTNGFKLQRISTRIYMDSSLKKDKKNYGLKTIIFKEKQ